VTYQWEWVVACLTLLSSTVVAVSADGTPGLIVIAIALLLLSLGLAIHSVYNLSRHAPRQTSMRRAYFIAVTVVWLMFVVAIPIGAWTDTRWLAQAGFLGVISLPVAGGIFQVASSRTWRSGAPRH
jgi:FtsH-binding integral membrane protein